ncbi:MAG: AzlC family ABC transporter permease [Bacteroidia bacterium]|nr:AzlC family ABC transporter permease [Bacteroidia bacterium]
MQNFKTAFRLSLPVLGAYWFLGITYGLLASSMGYDLWVPMVMATLIYSGSVEFLALSILTSAFDPTAAMVMALMVGARHLFYGIAMLDRYRGAGWKKPLLIYWLSDETFAVNYASNGSYTQSLWVSVLDYLYWLSGGVMGYVLGATMGESLMHHLEGLDFVVTAMFVAIFMDDYLRNRQAHMSAWLGIGAATLCLMMFGPSQFIIPTMLCILGALYIKYRRTER